MFILASASPARKKLLHGHRFKVVPSGAREVRRKTLKATCVTNARLKADAVSRQFPHDWVLAADTMIACQGKIHGKPRTRAAGARLLRSLAGRTHVLGTGVVLQKGSFRIIRFVTSKVTLHKNPPIDKIVARLDPTKYAGGYAIREKNDPLIARIDGSVSNVIGLPMEVVEPLLKSTETQDGAETQRRKKEQLLRGYSLV